MMTGTHLSPAMRTMLRIAIKGVDLYQGMGNAARKAGGGTRSALIARGLLDANDKPTSAGIAIFNPVAHSHTPHAGVPA